MYTASQYTRYADAQATNTYLHADEGTLEEEER
jgi:hypothetical protein